MALSSDSLSNRRRKRDALRTSKKTPLFALQELSERYQNYTAANYAADLKRRKSQPAAAKKPKTRSFDWDLIRDQAPDLFRTCRIKEKTRAVIYFRTPTGKEITAVVRSHWFGDYGENRLPTLDFIRLFAGSLKTFLSHPAVLAYDSTAKFPRYD